MYQSSSAAKSVEEVSRTALSLFLLGVSGVWVGAWMGDVDDGGR